jgi:hypothetical protein
MAEGRRRRLGYAVITSFTLMWLTKTAILINTQAICLCDLLAYTASTLINKQQSFGNAFDKRITAFALCSRLQWPVSRV